MVQLSPFFLCSFWCNYLVQLFGPIIPILLILFLARFSSLARIGSGIGLNRRPLLSNWCNFPPATKHPLSLSLHTVHCICPAKHPPSFCTALYTLQRKYCTCPATKHPSLSLHSIVLKIVESRPAAAAAGVHGHPHGYKPPVAILPIFDYSVIGL